MRLPAILLSIHLVCFLISSVGCGNDAEQVPADGDLSEQVPADSDLMEQEATNQRNTSLAPPPKPADSLGYETEARTPKGTNPTPEEITAFTKKITGFYKDTQFWDWVYRGSHGLDKSYDPDMFDYRLWWQNVSMVKKGDVVEYKHQYKGTSENMTDRSIKVMDNAIALYLLTGDPRMGEIAAGMMRGIVALSLGLERETEDPLVKYLQARSVFNHNHEYEVDGRKVAINYDGGKVDWFKGNLHVFNIPDNPTFGDIWVANMRSKDDVPQMYYSLVMATRAYYEAKDDYVREAAELLIEYMRGFSQSIEDNDWHILTKYKDGLPAEALNYLDTASDGSPTTADLGSFVHWREVLGPDAECNGQLGAAMSGYGWSADRGDCGGGLVGWNFELLAFSSHFFNYENYNYFHIAALAVSELWGYHDIAKSINEGLVYRFEEIMYNPDMPNIDDPRCDANTAAWLLNAAAFGYAFTAEEAHHVMKWYGDSATWFKAWSHWDPWSSMTDGQEVESDKPDRCEWIPGQGDEPATRGTCYINLYEMPYIFEYCYSKWKNPNGVSFIDCDIVADPSQWGE